jgi:hypothetical protein
MQSSNARVVLSVLLVSSFTAVAAISASAQAPSAPAVAKPLPEAITLTGCVSGKPIATGEYTFQDTATGSKYRLTGKGMRKFAGQQVEIVAGKDRKLVVKGGLYPSPNVAAQSGALDPAQEAIARMPGGPYSGTGTELPEFRVGTVRGVPGACQ